MDEYLVDPTIAASPHWLSLVDHLKVKAFVELTLATSVREGVQNLYRFVSESKLSLHLSSEQMPHALVSALL